MRFTTRILLALCVFAGMVGGAVRSDSHGAHDECASHHCGSHDSHEDGVPHDSHDSHKDRVPHEFPHHHGCCHFPSADCTSGEIVGIITFQPILVEISPDVPLVPEEPVFALDKPPLI